MRQNGGVEEGGDFWPIVAIEGAKMGQKFRAGQRTGCTPPEITTPMSQSLPSFTWPVVSKALTMDKLREPFEQWLQKTACPDANNRLVSPVRENARHRCCARPR
jgi:hypothetical protein